MVQLPLIEHELFTLRFLSGLLKHMALALWTRVTMGVGYLSRVNLAELAVSAKLLQTRKKQKQKQQKKTTKILPLEGCCKLPGSASVRTMKSLHFSIFAARAVQYSGRGYYK